MPTGTSGWLTSAFRVNGNGGPCRLEFREPVVIDVGWSEEWDCGFVSTVAEASSSCETLPSSLCSIRTLNGRTQKDGILYVFIFLYSVKIHWRKQRLPNISEIKGSWGKNLETGRWGGWQGNSQRSSPWPSRNPKERDSPGPYWKPLKITLAHMSACSYLRENSFASFMFQTWCQVRALSVRLDHETREGRRFWEV